jgi:hypothetical protein
VLEGAVFQPGDAYAYRTLMQEEPEPLFIIGAYRSGTSVLSWALGQHPNIFVLPETYWIASLAIGAQAAYAQGQQNPGAAHLPSFEHGPEEFFPHQGRCIDGFVRFGRDKLRHRYDIRPWLRREDVGGEPYQWFRAGTEPKRRWVDGTPRNALCVYELVAVLPRARFLHLVRSPHEVARSLMQFQRAGGPKHSQKLAYKVWFHVARAAWRAERAFGPERVRRIYYRDLTERPEQLIRECLELIGEPYSPDCLLPLARRINSSEVEGQATPDQRYRGGRFPAHIRRAEELFAQIGSPQTECRGPDEEVYRLLQKEAERRARVWIKGQELYERYTRVRERRYVHWLDRLGLLP